MNKASYASAYAVLGSLRSKALNTQTIETCLSYNFNEKSGIPSFLRKKKIEKISTPQNFNYFTANIDYFLKIRKYNTIKRLKYFLKDQAQQLLEELNYYLFFYSIKDIIRKIILQKEFNNQDIIFFNYTSSYFTKGENTDFDSLQALSSCSTESWINQILTTAINLYQKNQNLSTFENMLDMMYYRHLWDSINNFKKNEQEHLKNILGNFFFAEIFKITIELKFFYDLIPSQILTYIFFPKPYLTESTFWQYIEKENISALVRTLPANKFSNFIKKGKSTIDSAEELRLLCKKFQWELVHKRPIIDPLNIGNFLNFIFQQDIISRDIRFIIQSKKLGKAKKETIEDLITYKVQ